MGSTGQVALKRFVRQGHGDKSNRFERHEIFNHENQRLWLPCRDDKTSNHSTTSALSAGTLVYTHVILGRIFREKGLEPRNYSTQKCLNTMGMKNKGSWRHLPFDKELYFDCLPITAMMAWINQSTALSMAQKKWTNHYLSNIRVPCIQKICNQAKLLPFS